MPLKRNIYGIKFIPSHIYSNLISNYSKIRFVATIFVNRNAMRLACVSVV